MADISKIVDKAHEGKEFSELVNAPIDALQGLSEADAKALKSALNIKTVGDLATNKFVRAAQAIAALGGK